MPAPQEIAKAVWDFQLTSPTSKQAHAAGTFVRYQDDHFMRLTAQINGLTATVKTLAGLAGKNVDTAAVVSAVENAIASAVVHVEVTTGDDAAPPAAS